MGGKKLSEREGHFNDERKPKNFDTKQVFLSPSIRYSGHKIYAHPSKFKDKATNKVYSVRIVFQVWVNPMSYTVGPETIGAKHEIDPKFNNQELEWFTKQRGSIIMYGLLVNME
ncbi:neuralized-like protein 4 [Glandiceps talaboti]